MVAAAALALMPLQAPPATLSAETFDQVFSYAAPKGQDLAFQQIDWHTSLFSAVNEARQIDKPILMWLYFGDPRGAC